MKAALLLIAALTYSFNSHATYDSKQIDCIAKNIYFEARGEGTKGMIAVAQVTKNRVNSGTFPDSYCKVVYQSNQFSWVAKRPKVDKTDEAWQVAKNLARVIYYVDLPQDPTHGALYFHSGKDKPYWTKVFKKTIKIKGHTFYKPVSQET
ncbi:cell wall hydrolyse [Salmonella phage S124]|uniref:Cell wall hydrolyse n=1 Tax=Salmonella phage S124 TaxID=2231351 RepID=A0A2Z5HSN2_9CAUD|nr:endolysin [Salmonella phage S124]AXC43124.1 cell wall hydrolyse [Salmonella phage S124]